MSRNCHGTARQIAQYNHSLTQVYKDVNITRTGSDGTNEPRHVKTNKVTVRPAKTQISLGIRPVLSEFLLCAQWVATDTRFLRAASEDSDQIGWMPWLI